MLKNEFEAITGRQASDEEFKEANRIYMAAEGMDKMTFCRAWKEGDFRAIAEELVATVERNEKHIDELTTKFEIAEERAAEVASHLQCYSDKYKDGEMKTMAHLLVGDRRATKIALRLGCSLDQHERDLLLNIME